MSVPALLVLTMEFAIISSTNFFVPVNQATLELGAKQVFLLSFQVYFRHCLQIQILAILLSSK